MRERPRSPRRSLAVAALAAARLRRRRRRGRRHDAATTTTAAPDAQGRARHRLGQLNDRGFNQLAYVGLQRAERELGIKGRVVESRSAADYVPNMTSLARAGLRPDHRRRLRAGRRDRHGREAASRTRSFAIVDVDQSGACRQAGERRRPALPRGGGRLPRRLPRGARGEAPAGAGRRSAPSAGRSSRRSTASSPATRPARRRPIPGSRSLNGYSQDWDDQAKCKEIALNQIARGLGRRLPGRGRLRARRARRGQGEEASGGSASTPTSRSSARRSSRARRRRSTGRVPDDQVGAATARARAAATRLRARQDRRRPRQDQPEGAEVDDVAKMNKIRADIISGKIKNIPKTVGKS